MKNAKDLWVLESSILASLPKWQTEYSPYRHPDRVLWYPYTFDIADEKNSLEKIITEEDLKTKKEYLKLLKDYISGFNIKSVSESRVKICWLDEKKMDGDVSIDKNGCSLVDYDYLTTVLDSIKIKKWEK